MGNTFKCNNTDTEKCKVLIDSGDNSRYAFKCCAPPGIRTTSNQPNNNNNNNNNNTPIKQGMENRFLFESGTGNANGDIVTVYRNNVLLGKAVVIEAYSRYFDYNRKIPTGQVNNLCSNETTAWDCSNLSSCRWNVDNITNANSNTCLDTNAGIQTVRNTSVYKSPDCINYDNNNNAQSTKCNNSTIDDTMCPYTCGTGCNSGSCVPAFSFQDTCVQNSNKNTCLLETGCSWSNIAATCVNQNLKNYDFHNAAIQAYKSHPDVTFETEFYTTVPYDNMIKKNPNYVPPQKDPISTILIDHAYLVQMIEVENNTPVVIKQGNYAYIWESASSCKLGQKNNSTNINFDASVLDVDRNDVNIHAYNTSQGGKYVTRADRTSSCLQFITLNDVKQNKYPNYTKLDIGRLDLAATADLYANIVATNKQKAQQNPEMYSLGNRFNPQMAAANATCPAVLPGGLIRVDNRQRADRVSLGCDNDPPDKCQRSYKDMCTQMVVNAADAQIQALNSKISPDTSCSTTEIDAVKDGAFNIGPMGLLGSGTESTKQQTSISKGCSDTLANIMSQNAANQTSDCISNSTKSCNDTSVTISQKISADFGMAENCPSPSYLDTDDITLYALSQGNIVITDNSSLDINQSNSTQVSITSRSDVHQDMATSITNSITNKLQQIAKNYKDTLSENQNEMFSTSPDSSNRNSVQVNNLYATACNSIQNNTTGMAVLINRATVNIKQNNHLSFCGILVNDNSNMTINQKNEATVDLKITSSLTSLFSATNSNTLENLLSQTASIVKKDSKINSETIIIIIVLLIAIAIIVGGLIYFFINKNKKKLGMNGLGDSKTNTVPITDTKILSSYGKTPVRVF